MFAWKNILMSNIDSSLSLFLFSNIVIECVCFVGYMEHRSLQ